MEEQNIPIVIKNGTLVSILTKISLALGILTTVSTILTWTILWYSSVNAFQEESIADRKEIWKYIQVKDSIRTAEMAIDRKMLIELNWNMKESFRETHPNNIYNWKTYEEIKREWLLNN